MTYGNDRTGPGRWCVVMTPCAGMLWTNDTDSVGFQPVPKVDGATVDPTPLTMQIDAWHDAGRTPTEAFNLLAALVGKNLTTGDLTTWKPAKNRPRPHLGSAPAVTSAATVTRLVTEGDQ